jgi:hypothetical protein
VKRGSGRVEVFSARGAVMEIAEIMEFFFFSLPTFQRRGGRVEDFAKNNTSNWR